MSTRQIHGGVLLIGGASGVGKTSVAKQLGLRLGRSWLYLDDVRLAFQRSRVTLPEKTEALYFFEETPAVWTLPPEHLRDGLIGVGQVLARGRGVGTRPETELRTEARAKWLYGQWLAEEANRFGLPVMEPRPWSTLVARILTARSASEL